MKITKDNVEKYITQAKLGSIIRLEDGKNVNMHSMILVDKDDTNFVVYHGNVNGKITFTHYTFEEFATDFAAYRYFAYIYEPYNTSSSGGGGGGGGSTTYYTVKFDTGDEDTTTTKKVVKNSKLTKPTDPTKDGYEFTGWYTDSLCTKEYDFTLKVTNAFTLYAGWEKISSSAEDLTEDEKEIKAEKDVKTIEVTIGSKKILVGDDEYNMDVAPYIQSSSSSTLVPLRFVSLAICNENVENATNSDKVLWDANSKTATIVANGNVIQFTSGSNVMVINGKESVMDNGVKAEITNDRMFIPFRALGKALDVDVDWNAETKTAIYKAVE